jgi:DNA replication factor GINS
MIEELLTLIEKNRTQLTKIEENVYEKIRSKIEELEEKKGENERIEDEIKTLRRLQRRLFELRTGKIINAAWAEVCGQEVGFIEENMSPLEREFFRDLVEKIREFQKKVF